MHEMILSPHWYEMTSDSSVVVPIITLKKLRKKPLLVCEQRGNNCFTLLLERVDLVYVLLYKFIAYLTKDTTFCMAWCFG